MNVTFWEGGAIASCTPRKGSYEYALGLACARVAGEPIEPIMPSSWCACFSRLQRRHTFYLQIHKTWEVVPDIKLYCPASVIALNCNERREILRSRGFVRLECDNAISRV